MVEELPPSRIVRFVLEAKKHEVEIAARPIWYMDILAAQLDRNRKPQEYNEFMARFSEKPKTKEKTAEEIMADLMPIAERARRTHG